MHYFIPILLFLLLNHCLFFAFTSGNGSIEDDALVELAKGPEYFNKFCADKGLIINEKNQFVSDKYEAHLGLLYVMRMEWDYVMKTKNNINIFNELDNFRQFAFILYEYIFWQYVAEYVKAVDPTLAEQISITKNPTKPKLKSNRREIMFCEAIQNWAFVWKNEVWNHYATIMNHTNIYLANKQTLIDEYGLNLNKWYKQDSLFDMQKLKLNANSKFDNSFPRLRKMFDFNMEKLKRMAMKKASIIDMLAGTLNDPSLLTKETLIWHINHTPFYGIDKAIDDNIFLVVLKEMHVEKFGAKLETAPLSANAKSLIQTKKPLIKLYLKDIYLIRLKWQCAQIKYYQKECTKFRKYFNFLYEYLFRTYNEADNPEMPQQFAAVRPNFVFESEKKIKSLFDVVKQLAPISAFFFDPTYAKEFDYKLDKYFKKYAEPKLLNESEVSGEKTIGQKVFESVAKIGKSPKKVQEEKAAAAVLAEKQQLTFNLSRANFDNFMRENFEKLHSENDYDKAKRIYKWLYLPTNKKAGKMPVFQEPKPKMPKAQVNDGTAIVSHTDDELFLAFVEDSANFENHCIEMERQNLLARVGLLSKRKGKGKYDIGETVRYLRLQYEAYLGIVYLLKKKWNCNWMEMDESMYIKCKKFKRYLLVLYEFLFRKYLEVNCPSFQLATTVPPIFQLGNSKTNATIIDVLDSLGIIWAFFFDYEYGKKYENKLQNLFKMATAEPKWLNEETIVHKIVKNLQQITKYGADFKQILGNEKSYENDDELKQNLLIDEATNQHSSKANSDKAIQSFREAFDGIIKSMAETAKTMEESEEGFGKNKKLLHWLFR